MRMQMKLVDWMLVDNFTWEGKTSVQLVSCKDRKSGWTVLDCSWIPWLGPVFDAVPDTFPRIVDGSERLISRLNDLNQVEPSANSNSKPYLLSTKFWIWTIGKTRKGQSVKRFRGIFFIRIPIGLISLNGNLFFMTNKKVSLIVVLKKQEKKSLFFSWLHYDSNSENEILVFVTRVRVHVFTQQFHWIDCCCFD